ncbi:hypothetical protein VKT23_020390 [Stygiomarasmius scandens]|uniref:Uncharacterized protein n=1 Tax=Marasmiellus scandens TaxID=2682957 RepID=A0ABR1IM08_9AGAR
MLGFQGPIERLCCLSAKTKETYGHNFPAIETEYLSHSMEPVRPDIGPVILPTKTYAEAVNAPFAAFSSLLNKLFLPGLTASYRHVKL